MSKQESYLWACSRLRELVEKDSYGTVTIAMAAGKINGLKKEINEKPSVDSLGKKI